MTPMDKVKLPPVPREAASLQEQALAELKQDKLVYKEVAALGLSTAQVKEGLAVLIDFQEDLHYCQHCPGYDRCNKGQPHYCIKLAHDGVELKRLFEPCPLLRARQEYANKFIYHDFPEEWQDKDLRSIDRTAKRNAILLEFGKIIKGASARWLYLSAKSRSGKSFLLACFANTYSLKRSPVAYCVSGAIIDELKSLSLSKAPEGKERFDRKMAGLSRCPLLVLDDFGNEFISDYTFSSILFPILYVRARAGLVTCFASDYTIEEVGRMYGEKISGIKLRQFLSFLREKTEGEIDAAGLELY